MIAISLLVISNFASISFAAEKTSSNEDIGIMREKPKGNYCGPDDKTPDSVNKKGGNFIKIPNEFHATYIQEKDDANVTLFDRWSFIDERRACSLPFTIEEYYNYSSSVVTCIWQTKNTDCGGVKIQSRFVAM
jgi:hypothetical protein